MRYRIAFTLSLFTALLVLTSCFGLFDSSSDKIVGPYKVLWIDLRENQFICEESEQYSTSCFVLIPEYVFAVGHDDNFIIAKQHPTSGFENGYKVNPLITNYFVVNTKRKMTKEKVIGPLTRDQFDQKTKELHIEGIKFDMTYPDVP